jgi:hypothetical protein
MKIREIINENSDWERFQQAKRDVAELQNRHRRFEQIQRDIAALEKQHRDWQRITDMVRDMNNNYSSNTRDTQKKSTDHSYDADSDYATSNGISRRGFLSGLAGLGAAAGGIKLASDDKNKKMAAAQKDAIEKKEKLKNTPVFKTLDLPGAKYEGMTLNNQPHGNGKIIYNHGTYEGEFKNGQRHGNGKMIEYNGKVFEGQWKDNRPWNGKIRYKDYETHFLNGNMFTESYKSSNGTYVGYINQRGPNGKGIFTYSDGAQFDGTFDDDTERENGIFTYPDGNATKIVNGQPREIKRYTHGYYPLFH